GIGGSVQVGVTAAWNQIDDTTLAYIGDPSNSRTSICSGCGVTAAGNVSVGANSTENLYAIGFAAAASGSSGKGADGESSSQPTGETAASNSGSSGEGDNGAGGGSYGFGISGEIAFNQISTASVPGGSGGPGVTTDAFINNGASVTAGGDINLTATDTSFAVAASVAGALGQSAALAGAYAQNTFDKQVEAFTENTTLSGKGLDLTANGNDDLFDDTVGGSVDTETGIALAGAVNNNSITNTTEAYLGAGTKATGIGSDGITLSAEEGSNPGGDQVVSVAGGFGFAIDGGGVGAGIDIGNYTNTVLASVDSGADTSSSGNAEITAKTNFDLLPIAATFAAGSDFGAAGSLAYEQVTNNTTGSIDGTLSTDSNLLIASNDTTNVTIVAGGVGVSTGDVGVGVTAIIPFIDRTTTASIGDGASVTALGSDSSPVTYDNQTVVGMLLDSTASGSLQDFAVSGGIASSVGAAGAVIINPFLQSNPDTLDDDTEATIGSNATVNGNNAGAASDQSVLLEASDSTGILDVAGMLAAGSDAGVGVGYDQVVPVWTVKAGIASGATVNAAGSVVTTSTLDNSLNSYAGAIGLSAAEVSVSVAGAASVLNVTTTTDAYINGTVNAGGSVEVAADRNTNALDTYDGDAAVAISLGAGLGVSVSNITTNDTVDAMIGPNAIVTALGNGSALEAPDGALDGSGNPELAPFQGVSVTALSYGSVNPTAAGVAASGVVGGQGSVVENNLTEHTIAEIDQGAQVNVLDDDGAQ
ncbi:MAG: beta strand repeat-containing protein, partial [Gemmataceae bacterium]